MTSASVDHPAAAGRDAAVDFLRAGCILYIVGFWHLVPYSAAFPGYANVYTECIKDIALGTFVFCSGLLLAARPLPLDAAGLATFYRRRLVRIYPLYAAALLGFGVIGLANRDMIVHALLLVSMFVPPAPWTLWFISMIMTFYLVTPFLVRLSGQPAAYVSGGILLLVLGALWHLHVQPLDTRLLQYLPCFLLGIAWQRIPVPGSYGCRGILLLLAGLVVSFLLYRLQHAQTLSAAFGRIPTIVTGTVLLFQAVSAQSHRLQSEWITRIAYGSFCIYLFHRLVFHYAIELYFPSGGSVRLLYLVCVVLPVIVLVAFAVQTAYDRLLRSIWRI